MQTCLWSTFKRFTEFQESLRNKPYERQKDSLEVQLSSFLRSLVPPKKFSAAIAEDIVKFLISMDAAGKQKLHVRSCSSKTWSCPKSLPAGTVDSYIGKLRAIFNMLGRTGFSNSLAHSCVKEYLMFVREEADELFRLKDGEGFLLNFTFSKTRCAGQLRPFCSVTRYTKCICLPGFLVELLYSRMWGVRCPSSGWETL